MLHLILNLIFGFAAYFFADWFLAKVGASNPIKVILAVLFGIVIFFANLADYVL